MTYWWIVPALITVVSLLWCVMKPMGIDGYGGSHGGFVDFIMEMFQWGVATVISLVAWLIYFLLN